MSTTIVISFQQEKHKRASKVTVSVWQHENQLNIKLANHLYRYHLFFNFLNFQQQSIFQFLALCAGALKCIISTLTGHGALWPVEVEQLQCSQNQSNLIDVDVNLQRYDTAIRFIDLTFTLELKGSLGTTLTILGEPQFKGRHRSINCILGAQPTM